MAMTDTSNPQERHRSIASGWKVLVVVIVAIVVVLAIIGLVYSMPWSKVMLTIYNDGDRSVEIRAYMDGTVRLVAALYPGGMAGLILSTDAGIHTIEIDRGYWHYTMDSMFPDGFWFQIGPDGEADIIDRFIVGLSTTHYVEITLD